MYIILFALGWLICSVLAFGVHRYDWSERFHKDWKSQVWRARDTLDSFLYSAFGPISLVLFLTDVKYYGLRYTIPNDILDRSS